MTQPGQPTLCSCHHPTARSAVSGNVEPIHGFPVAFQITANLGSEGKAISRPWVQQREARADLPGHFQTVPRVGKDNRSTRFLRKTGSFKRRLWTNRKSLCDTMNDKTSLPALFTVSAVETTWSQPALHLRKPALDASAQALKW